MTEQLAEQPEAPERTGYAESLRALNEQAKTDVERAGAVSIVFDQALEDASQELITSSTTGKSYSREQLELQFTEAAQLLEAGDTNAALVRLPSSGGLRAALKDLIDQSGGKEAFLAYAARFEALNEEERGQIEKEIGDEALEASGVNDPEPGDGDFEHARLYSPGELRELREKAASLFDEEAPTAKQQEAPATEEGVEPSGASGAYDDLFSPDRTYGSVEDAAVRTETDEERLTRQRRTADEADAAIKRAGRAEMN